MACATASWSCAKAIRRLSSAAAEATQEKVLRAATDSEPSKPALRLVPNDEPATTSPAAPAPRPGWTALLAKREMGLVAAMLAVVIPVAFINPLIFSAVNLTSLAMDASLLMIAALAQMLVLVTRNIDLSVASVIGLSAYGSALVMTQESVDRHRRGHTDWMRRWACLWDCSTARSSPMAGCRRSL